MILVALRQESAIGEGESRAYAANDARLLWRCTPAMDARQRSATVPSPVQPTIWYTISAKDKPTMKIAYIDCFSGVAGDMLLAGLLDAGVPVTLFQETIRRLNLPEVAFSSEKVKKQGFAATHVRVHVDPAFPKRHRHLHHIIKIIDAADLPTAVAEQAKRIFARLAEAEALVHSTTIEKVHFHEVGAADAIVDIVCAAAGFAHLGVGRIVCSPIPTGSGTVTCDHGVMPVPAPATAQLLRNVPIAACDEPGELATPTGVAIVSTLAAAYGPIPAMTPTIIGVGAGTRDGKTRPNVLRILVGASATGATNDEFEHDEVAVLEAQLDDCTGQNLAFAAEQLLAAGALDAYLTPIIMKKGRPGQLLSVLAASDDAARLEALMLRQTTTFGVRRSIATRTKLARTHATVETRFGPIRVKVGNAGGQTIRAWPEYEDCAAAALRSGATLSEVQQEALRAYTEQEHG